MKVKQVIDGKTHTGRAYWSDRTIPGRWVYPEWWDQSLPMDLEINSSEITKFYTERSPSVTETLDLMIASPEFTEYDNAQLRRGWKNKS